MEHHDFISNKDLLILETYPAGVAPYDGLSGIFNVVAPLGRVVEDSSMLSEKTVLVCGIAPLYEHRISARNRNVIFTTFESDALPEHWVTAINRYQHCIVPHAAIKEVFVSSGVRIPVSVVHQGYRRYERRKPAKQATESFHIGFLGAPVNRKNLCKLYMACRELQQADIPELKLHVHVAAFYDWLDPQPFERMQRDGMVCWTSGKYTPQETAEWYHQLDCYIFPSSGEGWSYTPRESMYLGIPTIISDIPVHDELVKSGYYSVIRATGKVAADFNGAVYGSWNNIEVEEIKRAITDIYQRREHYQRLAGMGAVWIAEQWGNEEVGERIQELIARI